MSCPRVVDEERGCPVAAAVRVGGDEDAGALREVKDMGAPVCSRPSSHRAPGTDASSLRSPLHRCSFRRRRLDEEDSMTIDDYTTTYYPRPRREISTKTDLLGGLVYRSSEAGVQAGSDRNRRDEEITSIRIPGGSVWISGILPPGRPMENFSSDVPREFTNIGHHLLQHTKLYVKLTVISDSEI